ncbi:hypothetical protein D3C80_1326820 [compost metagenome]
MELRPLACSSWPAVRVRLSISLEVICPPANSCGSRRPSLKVTTGSLGCRVPRRASVLDSLTLAVTPALLYSSTALPSLSSGNSWPGVRSRPALVLVPPESSLTPSRPMASTPKPTVPSV